LVYTGYYLSANQTADNGVVVLDSRISSLVTANNTVVAQGRVLKTVPFRFSTEETLDFGEDTGTPVDMSYDVPFRFTGDLGKVVIDLK
jgi:hypothetical protein